MRVGVVSLGWPPVWAGGETYLYRIVDALNEMGIEAKGITATSADNNYGSSDDNAIRIIPPFAPTLTKDTIKIMFQDTEDNYRNLSKEEQLERMKIWSDMINEELEVDEFDIGIIYVENLTSLSVIDYKELLGRPFKKLISISFDVDYNLFLEYERDLEKHQTLLNKVEEVSSHLRAMSKSEYKNLTTRHYNPEMEGILHLTNFTQQVINRVFGKRDYEFVLHPLMEKKWLETPISSLNLKSNTGDFVVGMINPIPKKGSDIMLKVIAQSPYKFKILEGGHGNGNIFRMSLQDEYSYDFGDRVELIHYVEDMVEFFDSIDVLFMPSMIEGYGQVAHEAIVRGTPVITKKFPTIQEATLNKASFVEPHDYQDVGKWLACLTDIYENQEEWRKKTLISRTGLIDRQHREVAEFIDFLIQMGAER